MTRNTFHHRGEVLRAVTAEADRRLDGRLPLDVEGVAETFGDELTLLGALQLRWHARLSGRIERELLLNQPTDLEAAVVDAWRATAEELPGTRAVIDHHREHPLDEQMATAVAKATAKEHTVLAVAAGLASAQDAAAARTGARIEAEARATYAVPQRVRPPQRATFLDRVRSALVA
ncbi:hypothetical protein [Nocardioides dongkuii]|uniref:hypothetical protein n=1 Tax=Nocardioides dongkuii TaxID=2760089 RepID=UPI0015F990DC|nr:hypothetical protein [Nocardioides dongkuii]